MPTYQVGDVNRGDVWRPVPQRVLLCESCGAVLGFVAAVQPHTGMTATSVAGVFPAARPLVEHHERECPAVQTPATVPADRTE